MQGMFNDDEGYPAAPPQRYLQSEWKRPVTVVNTGHIGYSPEQYYYSLWNIGDRVKPQFVVVSVCPNDFGDGMAVLRGEGDWSRRGRILAGRDPPVVVRRTPRSASWCPSRRTSRSRGFGRTSPDPGPICRVFRTLSFRYCDPLNDFTDEFLGLRRRREGGSADLPVPALQP